MPDFQMEGWIGMFVPKGTDKAVVERLAAALRTTVSDTTVAVKISEQVGEERYMSPQELGLLMVADRARLQKVVRAARTYD